MHRLNFALYVVGSMALSAGASAATIFSDNFESGNLNNWTATAASPFTIAAGPAQAVGGVSYSPGTYSAFQDTSADGMHHNIIADNSGSEITAGFTYTSWIYDPATGGTTSTRLYNTIRGYDGGTGLPNGGTTASGTLNQLIAIGKYNQTTSTGVTFNAAKYQARVVAGPAATAGWFNLDDASSPNRSIGWHKFTIERDDDATTYHFYVDDILSHTFTSATADNMDTVTIGSATGTTTTASYTDDISVATTPEPTSLATLALTGAGLLLRRRKA